MRLRDASPRRGRREFEARREFAEFLRPMGGSIGSKLGWVIAVGAAVPLLLCRLGHDLATTPRARRQWAKTSHRFGSRHHLLVREARSRCDSCPVPGRCRGSRRRLATRAGLGHASSTRLTGAQRARELFPRQCARAVAPKSPRQGALGLRGHGGTTQPRRAAGGSTSSSPWPRVWGLGAQIVAGFDRLYARLATGEIKALDFSNRGANFRSACSRQPPHFAMAFAYVWRAVVITDMRGPLATFDAGNSWHARSRSTGILCPLGGARDRLLAGNSE